MLNRTSPPDVFVSMLEDSGSIQILSGRWKSWTFGLHLPSTLQGYLFLVLCLLILAFTMALHITLSAESMRLDQRLAALQEDYARTERINANLVWEISQSSSLTTVFKQATTQGYVPIREFKYLVMGPQSQTDVLNEGTLPLTGSGWSVEPSSSNPVIVLDSASTVGAEPESSVLFETPGLNLSPAESTGSGVVVPEESPAWRDAFSMQGLRAATGETLRWIQDRLPRW